MSEMNRLRELAALFQPPKQLPEAAVMSEGKAEDDFKGIMSVVEDALADLYDKLGEGGALETMMDKRGLSDLDTAKDKNGHNMVESLDHAVSQFKKQVLSTLGEIELMIASMVKEGKEELTEMAKAAEFQGGAFYRKHGKEMARAFKAGEENFELTDKAGNVIATYEFDKPTSGSALKAGDIVFATHDRYNTGSELYEILGFGPDSGEVKYKTVKEAMAAVGVKNMKALEEFNSQHDGDDKEVRLIVKDMQDNESGAWFYVFNGRWSYGSGAEPLSFSLVKKV